MSTDVPSSPTLPPTNLLNARMVLFTRMLMNTVSFMAGDLLALSWAFFLASSLRMLLKGGHMMPEWSWYVSGLWMVLSLGMKLTPGWGLGVVESTRRLYLLLFTIFAGTSTALFLTKTADETSRFTLTLAFAFAAFLLPLLRQGVKRLLIRYQLWGMLVVIYGHREKVSQLLPILREGIGMGYIPVGIYLVDEGGEREIDRIPVLPLDQDPHPFAHAAIVLEPSTLRNTRPEFSEQISLRYRKALIVPELNEHAPSLWVTPRDLGGVAAMEISTNLLDPWSRLLKVMSETLVILLVLPLAFPLLLLIALLVWLGDFRSPFFVQTRIGFRGHSFRMWKFRTMRPDAETILQKHLEEDPGFREEWEKGFKSRKDPRITPLGRLLRSTSLDELPQLLNVLRGEMSIIGPRPLPAYHDGELPERTRDLRRRVRPGMTGLWQVSGRSESGNDGIIRWDAYYVRNWSLWLDLVILVRTVSAILNRKGAY